MEYKRLVYGVLFSDFSMQNPEKLYDSYLSVCDVKSYLIDILSYS